MRAMQSLIPEFYSSKRFDWTNEEIAKESYRIANEMLKERERKQEKENEAIDINNLSSIELMDYITELVKNSIDNQMQITKNQIKDLINK